MVEVKATGDTRIGAVKYIKFILCMIILVEFSGALTCTYGSNVMVSSVHFKTFQLNGR